MIRYLPMPILTMDNILRFWDKVSDYSDPSSCWLWVGCRNKDGYGHQTLNGTVYRANRISYWLHNHTDPKEFEVCHGCNNPPCINPKCLYLGTHAVNQEHAYRDGLKDMTGVANGNCKRTEQEVLEIRSLASKFNQLELAKMFNTTQSQISEILRRVRWQHI